MSLSERLIVIPPPLQPNITSTVTCPIEQGPSYYTESKHESSGIGTEYGDKASTIHPEIIISSKLKDLLDRGIIDERVIDLGKQMVEVICENVGGVISVIFSAYNPVEDFEFEDWIPYLEVKVKVNNAEEMLKLWDDIAKVLKQCFSQEDLEKISVFLTR